MRDFRSACDVLTKDFLQKATKTTKVSEYVSLQRHFPIVAFLALIRSGQDHPKKTVFQN